MYHVLIVHLHLHHHRYHLIHHHVITHLCEDWAAEEEVIVAIIEQEQVEEEEEVAAADDDDVPMLPDDRVAEMVQHLYHPYQLTHFYQEELVRFDEAFQHRINEQYENERRIFEQQQQQWENNALIK